MPRVKQTTVYDFAELSPEAQERAVAARQELNWKHFEPDWTTEWLATDAEDNLGVGLSYFGSGKQSRPKLYWDAGHGTAAFDGWALKDDLAKPIANLKDDHPVRQAAEALLPLWEWVRRAGGVMALAAKSSNDGRTQYADVEIYTLADECYDGCPAGDLTDAVTDVVSDLITRDEFCDDDRYKALHDGLVNDDAPDGSKDDPVQLLVLCDYCEERGVDCTRLRWLALCLSDHKAAQKTLGDVTDAAEEFVQQVAASLAESAAAEYEYQGSEEKAREDCEEGDDEYLENGDLT